MFADALQPSVLDVVIRLTVATGLAAVMGLQREFDGHDAGVRTHALLAGGAALFGAISVGAFGEAVTGDATNVRVDVTRIASYVAAGIGFLGGGVIVKKDGRAHGLTTAASLWSAAAIGLAAGLGFWVGAVTATALSLVLRLLEGPVAWFVRRFRRTPVRDDAGGYAAEARATGVVATDDELPT